MRRLFTFAFLLFLLTAFSLLHNRWDERRQSLLDEHERLLETTYRASVSMYHLATETFVKQVVQRPDILETFQYGQTGHDEDQSAARGRLYRKLAPAYEHLKQQGIHELHFHTASGKSFLRFQAPDRFNDSLTEVRPGIRQVQKIKQPLFGFEIGRLDLGFRYIFPLMHEGDYIGSVETSTSFKAIRNAMSSLEPNLEYHLVLRKKTVNDTLFREHQILYTTADINENFLSEDHSLGLPVSPAPPSPTVQHINEELAKNQDVQTSMNDGRSFSTPAETSNNKWIASFVPANDIAGNNVAYVIAYSPAPALDTMNRYLQQGAVLITLISIGLYVLSMRLFNAHRTLRQEKKHLQIITDTIGDGLYALDIRGVVIQVNPAFTEILGYQESEILGQIGHNTFHVHACGAEIPVAECPIILATNSGTDYTGEEVFRHKSGNLLTVELTCKPIIQDGLNIGSVTAFRDITARKADEKRLLESDRIKSEFIATASHELRTPLAVIQGYSEMLRDDPHLEPHQIRDFETIVYDKAVALEKIIDDLLDVSRIESGRQLCLEMYNVNIIDEINQLVHQFKKEVADREFILQLPQEQVPLYVDKFKFHQAFENLINNAVKFSGPGSSITISAETDSDSFTLSIADQGIGITPEKIPHIFDKFFRIDNSDTAVAGFGLGLYLVKQIIEAHQGSIRVESRPGNGTCFHIYLPKTAMDAPTKH